MYIKITMKINQFVPNIRNKTTSRTCSEPSFLLFFEDLNKQNKLINNNKI